MSTNPPASLRILMVNLVDFGQAAGDMLHEKGLHDAWRDQGHEVKILAPNYNLQNFPPSILRDLESTPSMARLGVPRSADTLCQIPALLKAMRQWQPDIVYTRLNSFTSFLVATAKLFGAKVIIEHNSWLPFERRNRDGRSIVGWYEGINQVAAARLAHFNVSVTEGLANHLLGHGVSKGRIVHIGNGTDTKHFYPINRRQALSQFGLPDEKRYIGIIGNIRRCHRVDIALQAFADIKPDLPDLKFLVFGRIKDPEEIQDQIRELSLQGCVQCFGPIAGETTNIAINCLDVGLCPLSEKYDGAFGFSSIKIRDYAAAGRPVLAGNVPGHDDFEDESWFHTHKPDAPDSMASALRNILQRSSKWPEMSQSARTYAEKHFDWSEIGKRILAEYSQAAHKHNLDFAHQLE